MPRDATLSLLSLLLALALSVVIGGLLGYSTNPDRSAAFESAHMELARKGVVARSIEELHDLQLELARNHPGFDSPVPIAPVAILKWHPLLLGALSLAFLCLFRPSAQWTAGVFLPVAAVCLFLVNVTAALGVVAAVGLSLLWKSIYVRLRTKLAP